MLRRHFVSVLAAVLIGGAVWLLMWWQPERQIRRHTEQLLSAVENKNWKRLGELMADDYSDQWGHDKSAVIEHSREVFSQFFAIELKAEDLHIVESDGSGSASARLILRGSGGPLAQFAIERVATLHSPFVFTWRLRSGKPWDWVLSQVAQPELRLD